MGFVISQKKITTIKNKRREKIFFSFIIVNKKHDYNLLTRIFDFESTQQQKNNNILRELEKKRRRR